jgi:adenylate kinase
VTTPVTERTLPRTTAPFRLAILGRQGAGKGTQCARLSAALNLLHVSSGDLLRAAVRDQTALGRQVEHILASGALVPDTVVTEVVLERLATDDAAAGGFLLDGFPRTLTQAVALEDAQPLDAVVDLVVPKNVVFDRLGRRRVCPICGTVTSAATPATPTVPCPKGDGVAVRRDDDTDDAIRRRLALYDAETGPVGDWFAARGLLVSVDAVGPLDDVFERIVTALVPHFEALA